MVARSAKGAGGLAEGEGPVVVPQAPESLDDRGLGGAAGIRPREVVEEAGKGRDQIRDERVQAQLTDERRGARRGLRALALQHG